MKGAFFQIVFIMAWFFLLASCTDSVLETVKMLRLCYASMAVLYNLQF